MRRRGPRPTTTRAARGNDRGDRALGRRPLLIGVVHLPPLPGSPRAGAGAAIDARRRAVADARAYLRAGFSGAIVENYGDAPWPRDDAEKATIAAMAAVAAAVRDACPRPFLVGANVLRNDARGAVAVAAAADLDFVRVNVLAGAAVTDQGIVQGDAAAVMRDRARLAPRLRVLADLRVKHAVPLGPRPLREEAQDLVERAGADALVLTGPRTGEPPLAAELEEARAAVPRATILVGSGASRENVSALLRAADGVIVGTSVERGGRTAQPVDPARARAFVRAAREATA